MPEKPETAVGTFQIVAGEQQIKVTVEGAGFFQTAILLEASLRRLVPPEPLPETPLDRIVREALLSLPQLLSMIGKPVEPPSAWSAPMEPPSAAPSNGASSDA